MIKRSHVLAVLAASLLVSLPGAVGLHAQANEHQLAAEIASGDVARRHLALDRVRELGPRNAGPVLRAALFGALEAEGRLEEARHRIARSGETVGGHPDPEFASRLTELVVEMADPASIPALTASLGTGATASIWALADFGEQASGAVLDVVTSPDSWRVRVNWALVVLRVMVEERARRHLPDPRIAAIRAVVAERLQEEESPSTLRRAIDLGIALEDPDLRRLVQRIALDSAEVTARGIDDVDMAARLRKHAADRLAGLPPLPRRP